jgi:alpha,alpha-trehalase
VRSYYRTHAVPDYDVSKYYDRAADRLTDLFFRADRAMRESGFDPSNRFGPFNAGILDHNPVCLNSLLFAMERDAATIAAELGRPVDATRWKLRAALRQRRVNELMWDEADGFYYDYDHVRGARRKYAFGTTVFPLWVGLATPHQAARVRQALAVLERPGGLSTSNNTSGNQWDEPFGWAPLQHAAAQGLRRYGFAADADRITVKFLSVVHKEFLEHGSIFEKYDVARRESSVAGGLKFGYSTNEIGFGWTNAAFIDLLADLPAAERERIARTAR